MLTWNRPIRTSLAYREEIADQVVLNIVGLVVQLQKDILCFDEHFFYLFEKFN